ncbi:MAG: C39 family peptidase [Acidobacteria bacterium]|nr:C39 family peptidase [Acidobacteriota bacterium]
MKVRPKWLLVVLVTLLPGGGCSIPADRGVKIGVPYRAQEDFNYCAAACVQMWALYDGQPEVSQQFIFDWMRNFSSGCGSNLRGVEDAVANFTATADAFIDLETNGALAYENLAARQITSIDNRSPVIAVVDNDHTVILNGGKWHAENEVNMWDYVYVHDPGDPFGEGDSRIGAADWLERFCPGYLSSCSQVISSGNISYWSFYLSTYGPFVEVRGACSQGFANIQCN